MNFVRPSVALEDIDLHNGNSIFVLLFKMEGEDIEDIVKYIYRLSFL